VYASGPEQAQSNDEKAQMQVFAEPFHRMFVLDNLSIGYPHAEVERVPLCMVSFTAMHVNC
jgi:hypothetical protein